MACANYDDDLRQFTVDLFYAMDVETRTEVIDSGFDESDIGFDWLNKLFDKDYTPQKSSKIYSRAFKIYFKT